MRLTARLATLLIALLWISSCEEPKINSQLKNPSINNQSSAQPNKTPLDSDIPEGRLPEIAYPLYYTLDLIIDPNQQSFTGHAKLKIELKKAADGIWLHGQELSVTSVITATEDGRVFPAEYSQQSDSGVAWVDFGKQFPAGPLTLIFDYQAQFDNNLSGLFKVEEQGDAYVLAKSESIQARKFLPSFDQPGFKSPYLISMTIPKGMTAISNTRETSVTDIDQQFLKFQFAETRAMPTYLLSIAVGPFDILEMPAIATNSVRDFEIPLRAIARRGRAKDMSFVMGITAQYMKLFELALLQPYPFKKLDIVAAPQWPSGATELSAAITYREQRVLLGDTPAPGAKLSIMNTHAHEIAHMWFGNLVTPPWWDDLWLKEGFSTWATPVILAQFEPDAGHHLNALSSNFTTMGNDSLASTRAIKQPILKNANIRNAYDSITYKKSQAVIHMIDSYFGAEKFRKALGGYLAEYADGVADSSQFYQSIGEKTNEPAITETFRQFVEQKGVPLMDISVDCKKSGTNTLTFKQSRYRPLGSLITSSQPWTVPMCIRYQSAENVETQCALISPQNNTLSLKSSHCPVWIMPNADGAGYYRWKLAKSDLSSLLLHFNLLTHGEQISLLDGVFSGFEAGNIERSLLLRAIQISTQSDLRQVVELPLSKLAYYIDQSFSKAIAKETITTITPWYLKKIGQLQSKQQDLKNGQQLLLNNLTKFAAETLNDQPIRLKLIALAENFIEDSKQNKVVKLSSDLYSAAFSIAVEEIGSPFYQKLVEARKAIDNPLFDNASAHALGSIRDIKLIERVQVYALSDQIGARESFAIIAAMLNNKELGEKHWLWFSVNLSNIIEKIPAQWRRRSPMFANRSCDTQRIVELERLFEIHGDEAPGHELALTQTKESIMLCDALKTHLSSVN